MASTFVEDEFRYWSWRCMLGRLPGGVMQQVVGPGVSRITYEPIPGLYDRERHRAAEHGEGPALSGMPLIWDFVVTRTDGTQVRFHPQDRRIWCASTPWYQRDGGAQFPDPRKKGLGRSNHKLMYEDC